MNKKDQNLTVCSQHIFREVREPKHAKETTLNYENKTTVFSQNSDIINVIITEIEPIISSW